MAGELITTDGQIEYGGVLLGAGTPYRWRELTGWEDMPDVSTGNSERPGAHGTWPGHSLAGERVITWTGRIKGVPLDQFSATVKAFRAATALYDDERELVIRTVDETLLTYGKITKRSIPQGLAYRVGSAEFAVQWVCSDPLRYSVDEKHGRAELAGVGASGLVYPLTYPLTYGPDPASASAITAINEMDAATPPRLEIRGPIEGPLVVNQTTGVQLEFDITLVATDVLTVDCRTGEVLLNGTADRLYTRTAASAPVELFRIDPRENSITLHAFTWSAGNSLDLYWRDATL